MDNGMEIFGRRKKRMRIFYNLTSSNITTKEWIWYGEEKIKKQDKEGPNGFAHSTEEEGCSLACLF